MPQRPATARERPAQPQKTAGYSRFEVHYYVAGKDAISASETRSLWAAVVDLVLPDCSGADVARHIRARHPQVLIVLITAADPGDLWRLAEEVGLHVLLKPFMEHQLLQILREQTAGCEQAFVVST